MQFYDLFKDLISYIPDSLGGLASLFRYMLPAVLVVCALFTAFFGQKCAALWCSVSLFFLGTGTAAKYLLPKRDLSDANYWTMLAVCLSIGVLLGVFSKYPARLQLVVGMFTLAYASLPSFITFFGDVFSKIVSGIVALALAFLTVKYKYIIVIVTTSFSGSFIFWNIMDDELSLQYKNFYAVIMGIAALAFQCYMNYDDLKATYKDVKRKAEKTEKEGKKAVNAVKEKMHMNIKLENIRVILWDFDNTLMDFSLAERNSLMKSFERFGLGECTEEMVSAYSEINAKYWKKLEAGEQTKEEILVNRFKEFFETYHIEGASAEEFNESFESGIADTVAYIENSKEIVTSLKGKFHQYIVTNGAYAVQKRRIKESGFASLVDGAFISDKLAYEKPQVEFFNAVFEAIPPYNKKEIVIVGDSLSSDMQGGNNAGIMCCWYNPRQLPRPKHLRIDMEIHSLGEIYKVLK